MKKRVLSMLLLAVMVFAAVPFSALTVFATDAAGSGTQYEEADYNKLYANQEDLVFAADFFATNEYWNSPRQAGVDYKTDTDWAKNMNNLLTAYRWKGTRAFSITNDFGAQGAQKAAEVANGKLTVYGANNTHKEFSISNLSQDFNDAIGTVVRDAEGNVIGYEGGATQEIVRANTASAVLKLWVGGVRFQVTSVDNANQANSFIGVAVGSDPTGSLPNKSPTSNSPNIVGFDWSARPKLPVLLTEIQTYRASIVRPETETKADNNNSTTEPYYTTQKTVYVNANGDVSESPLDGYVAKTVLSGLITGVNGRYNAHLKVKPDGILNENGTYTANSSNNEYRLLVDKFTAPIGHASVYQGTHQVYSNDEVAFLNSNYGYNSNDLAFTGNWGDIYAVRYYKSVLSADEAAQNHFADLAKYYRVDLTGLAAVTDPAFRKVMYYAVAGYQIGSEGAAEAVLAAIKTAIGSTFDTLKIAGATERNAFIDVAKAAGASLDVVALVLNADRNMLAVYEGIAANHAATPYTSAAAFEADATALYERAYYYDAYKGSNDALNAFITKAAEKKLYVEDFMALPFDARAAFAAEKAAALDALTQDDVDAFVEAELAKYAEFLPAEYNYDSIYVAEGLLGRFDFFKLNSYWADARGDLPTAFPMAPGDDPQYDGNRIKSDAPWIIVVVDGDPGIADRDYSSVAYRGAYTGETGDGAHLWRDDANYARLVTYATKQAALEALAALDADDTVTPSGTVLSVYGDKDGSSDDDDNKVLVNHADPHYGVAQAPGNGQWNGRNTTDEYQAAIDAYKTLFAAEFAKFGVGKVTVAASLPEFSTVNYHDHDGKNQGANVYLKDGYLQMTERFSGQSFLSFAGIPVDGDVTGEFVMTAGEAATGSMQTQFITFSDLALRRIAIENNTVSFDRFSGYGNTSASSFPKAITVEAGTTTDMTISMLVNRNGGDVTGAVYLNSKAGVTGLKMTDTSPTSALNYLGYSENCEPRVYALRFYERALTSAEMAQNHFADLAKWFRLDINSYAYLSVQQKAALHALFADDTIVGSDKAALQAKFDAAIGTIYYDTLDLVVSNDAAVNAKFFTLAKKLGLDVSAFMGVDPTAFGAIAADIVTKFDPAYAQNLAVVSAYLAPTANIYHAMTFAGYQVALDTGAAVANRAGIRAIFDFDTALLAKLAAGNEGKAISVTAELYADELVSSATFNYDAATGALAAAEGTEAQLFTRTTADGRTVTAFGYEILGETATYDKAALTKAYTFKYFVKIGDVTHDVTALSSFGETATEVSIADVYAHFASMEKYAEDRVVAEVLNAVAD